MKLGSDMQRTGLFSFLTVVVVLWFAGLTIQGWPLRSNTTPMGIVCFSMPQTAERFGVSNVFDVSENVDGGARYLSWLLDRFDGQTELALAGYNAGEGAVDRYRGVPPYPETKNYIDKVLREAARMGSETEPAGPPRGDPGRRVAATVTD